MLPRLLTLCLVLATAVDAAGNSPLASSSSRFVHAHAASKVQWHAWDAATLAAAKASGKSVYVFIGSPLSEHTRATINLTFTSEKTVAWLNENFFCLFVDADAQPDVAALGRHFINTVKQLHGAPVHLWLLPDDLRPYDGAGYLPPAEEGAEPGFLKAARTALDNWTVDPGRARALADEAADMMRLPALPAADIVDREAKLAAATQAWTAAADAEHGGFGGAPKVPEPELIRFLLTRDEPARAAAIRAARAVVGGTLRDPVDGGFYRRCSDEAWRVPYHQKTLADQARIALALYAAADAADDASLRAAANGALDFALKELRQPDGSYAAALDGTLAEERDRGVRPAFVRVGTARLHALALLAAALQRSPLPAHAQEGSALMEKLGLDVFRPVGTKREVPGETAADYLALAAVLRGAKAVGMATTLRNDTGGQYFDARAGVYLATTADLPPGITARVPVAAETPSAEVLALLAGAEPKNAALIRRGLLYRIEHDDLPPGDILLGLAQK